jgi:hypothetical protein
VVFDRWISAKQAKIGPVPKSGTSLAESSDVRHHLQIPAKLAEIRHKWPNFGHFRRNPANPDFGETGWNLGWPDSSLHHQNPEIVVRIR